MDRVMTICYGRKETWKSREKAAAFFLKCMAASEGSEHDRYAAVYTKLMLGMTECGDGVE